MRLSAEFGILFLVVATTLPLKAQEKADSLSPRLLPSEHLVHDFVADGLAHRFTATRLLSPHEVCVGTGGILPLVEYVLWDLPVQISSGASIQARLDPGQGIAVLSTEFSVDFFLLDIELADGLIIRTGMGHASHHLGDGAAKDSTRQPIDYSRDDVQLFIIHPSAFLCGQLYAGLRYNYALVIGQPVRKPLSFQIGIHALPWSLSPELSVYVGWDVKLQQELSYGNSQRYEGGLQYKTAEGRILRIAVSYSAGYDERGQFFGKRRSEAGMGIVVSL
ncbi:MAG: DUF1207 domain-containing protein [Bacteroidota bacterium]